jgi:hypothetical protein
MRTFPITVGAVLLPLILWGGCKAIRHRTESSSGNGAPESLATNGIAHRSEEDEPATEKVEKLGLHREPGYIYFVRGSEVWRAPMKERRPSEEDERLKALGAHVIPGLEAIRDKEEKVMTAAFKRDPDYIYFLDLDGDISRAKRRGAVGH